MLRGSLYLLIAGFFWGIIGVFVKIALAQGVSSLEFAFWRCFFASVFFGMQAVLFRKDFSIAPGDRVFVVLFGLILSASSTVYPLAIGEGGIALAAVLLYTTPALVALLAWWLLAEPLTRGKTAGVLLTIIGVALISGLFEEKGTHTVSLAAFGLGMLSAVTFTLIFIVSKCYLSQYTPMQVFLYAFPVAALSLVFFVDFAPKNSTAWTALTLMGLTTFFAYSFYFAGLKTMEVSRASLIVASEPVFAALAGYLFWDEQFSLLGYAGSGLILCAVILTAIGSRETNKQHTPTG